MANRSESTAAAMVRPKIENPRFFKLLKEQQIIPEDMIRDLIDELEGNALDVLATLIQSRVGTKRQLCQLWCDSIGIAHVDLEKSLFQTDVVRKLPERLAWQFYAVPVYRLGDCITVATATPDSPEIRNQLEALMGGAVNLVFALPQDIEWAIEHQYQTNSALYEFFSKIAASRAFGLNSPLTVQKLERAAGKEALNQFHVSLILYAITENASEIVIDPGKEMATISFIINEAYQERLQVETSIYRGMSEKLMKLARIAPEKKNEPHYSRILFPTPGKKFDIHFLSLPADTGEKIFLKLMDRTPLFRVPALTELYLSAKNYKNLKKHVDAQKGLLVISGPPKSGKSTAAYCVLKTLSEKNAKIMTVEDDLKFLLDCAEQYQVNPKAAFDREAALSACIKQHPHVIYIQHLDDPDLVNTVSEALKKGIFIIGTLSAGNAFEALAKCAKLKYTDAVVAIFNQVLVKRLCSHCRRPRDLPESTADELFTRRNHAPVATFSSTGCPYCRQTGFSGRMGIQEVLPVTSGISALLRDNAGMAAMRAAADRDGFEDHMHDGIKKVLRGLITLAEFEQIQPAAAP